MGQVDPYTAYIVQLGMGRGQTLVRVFDSGEVQADWRIHEKAIWRPISIYGGDVRTERAE